MTGKQFVFLQIIQSTEKASLNHSYGIITLHFLHTRNLVYRFYVLRNFSELKKYPNRETVINEMVMKLNENSLAVCKM